MTKVEIRTLSSWDDMNAVEVLQRTVWGEDERDLVPPHMLITLADNGGLVLGAFDGDKLVGALISFLGTDVDDEKRPAAANLKLYSKRMAVLTEYRNQGIGYHLKLAQRDYANKMGIRLITWTFDPLISRNAHMNIRKLGVLVAQYMIDYYGTNVSGLTVGGSSDRFKAEWWLTSNRVKERLNGPRAPLTLDQYIEGGVRVLNPTRLSAKLMPVPSEDFIQPPTALGLVEIPTDFLRIVDVDTTLAQAWREHIRQVFVSVLKAGYIITDFVHEPFEGRQRALYVCSHEGSLRRFSQN